MHLHPVSSLLTALVLVALVLVAGSSTSPLAYPNGKLEQINALRARGVPEVRICTCIPRRQRLLNLNRPQ